MMNTKFAVSLCSLSLAAASLVLVQVAPATAQSPQVKPAMPATSTAASTPAPTSDAAANSGRSVAYYHLALANIYEDEALETGNSDDARMAIDEYKYALNADPNSPQLNDGLADLYFRMPGHMHEAEVTARGLLKNSPNDIDAHKLL